MSWIQNWMNKIHAVFNPSKKKDACQSEDCVGFGSFCPDETVIVDESEKKKPKKKTKKTKRTKKCEKTSNDFKHF